jgi:hypothetical protein
MDYLSYKFSKLVFILALFTSGGDLLSQSQVNSPYIPNLIPPSPNAAALMKFTDVPVSPYTGTADITVPVYTIEAKGIKVPISINYHTGGIRLKEEASWVGLGWALNAGGMISRTIMGHDDFGTQGDIYFTNQCPQLPGDVILTQPSQQTGVPQISPYVVDFYCNYQFTTSAGTEDFTPAFGAGGDIYDMEPDIFSYNFPGHSGKFILNRSGAVVMQKQENIKIQFQGSGNQVTFSITDDHGNTFYFNVVELVALAPKPSQISSWLLSKIITQESDTVTFNYSSGGSTTSTAPETYQNWGTAYCTAMNGLTTTTGPTSAYFNQTLQSIDFANGHIQFVFDSTRNDLQGGYKLDSVLIYSKNAAGVQTYVKQDNLYYSYFNPTSGPSSPLEYYRLKLDSIKEKSGSSLLPPYAFTYNNPDPGLGTQKHAYNVDHWGYYNGASNTVLIPSMDIEYWPILDDPFPIAQFIQFSGGNRQPSFPAMQTFSLQQVTYPTGGKTVLTYQPNDYDYGNSLGSTNDPLQYVQLISMDSLINMTRHGTMSGTINLTNIFPVLPPLSQQTNITVNVAFRYLNNNNTTYSNTVGKIYFTLGGTTWDINGATCGSNSPVCSSNLSLGLNNTIYNWSAYIDPSIDTVNTFAGIYVSIQYQETQQVYNLLQNNSYITPASGLRVQSLTNYKDATTIASQKVYNYNYQQDRLGTGNPQQYSYGRLMSLPSYARYAITAQSNGTNCATMLLFSSSINSLTSVSTGNIVGYDQVTETNVDPVTGQDIGQTIFHFVNSPDTAAPYSGWRYPGTQNIGNNLNGLILSKTDYANNGGVYTKVAEIDNYFHATNRSVYYSPKYQYFQGTMSTSQCSLGITVETQTLACFYPSIKSERVLLDSTIKIFYQQGNASQFLSSTEAYSYDNPAHYQLTRTRSIDSKGDTLISRMKYPQDYIPNGNIWTGNTILDTMIGRNMVAETIELQDSLYYPGSSSGYITGAQLSLYRIVASNSNTVVHDKFYKLDVQSPVTNFMPFSFTNNATSMDSRNRQMISYDQYDSYNSIQQYTSTDQNPVTIVWDYKHKYPIAQAKNAALADVASTSFEADGQGGWSFSGSPITPASAPPTGNLCYSLSSGTISKTGLTSGTTYVVSYWSSTGSSYSVAGSTAVKQGKTINGWTYFEHTVSSVTSTSISGTGNIDELRLYPSTSQMTTYTYLPLVGMTTSCDVDNKVTYYFYDGLGRLKWVKDQDGNIIKTYQYHYLSSTTQY